MKKINILIISCSFPALFAACKQTHVYPVKLVENKVVRQAPARPAPKPPVIRTAPPAPIINDSPEATVIQSGQ